MNKKRKRIVIFLCLITTIIFGVLIYQNYTKQFAHFTPNYPRVNLRPILEKSLLTTSDYSILYNQTGLGKCSIDTLLQEYPDYEDRILSYQAAFFQPVDYISETIVFATEQEYLVDDKGAKILGFPLAPIKNGYIILTKGTHTLGWRHGHAGIVTDASQGEVLEAIQLGENSSLEDMESWRNYPSFMILKPKDANQSKLDSIAASAKKYLFDIPYNLTVGILSPKYTKNYKVSSTHCSHLVWAAFRLFDYDIDSDGGRIVTTKDIANSPLLEVVQIYGVDPDSVWH